MTMTLYTDLEPYCCEVLRARVADGGLPPGDVWERDICTLTAAELAPYRQVHLFCGIGGSPLGLKWAGWPAELSIVTGGFPCQDISVGGGGEGITGSRSGLWKEMARVIDAIRPDYAIVENSPALTSRGLGTVLGDLAEIGYDAEWHCIDAASVGAPHRRERIWIVAYPMCDRASRLEPVAHPCHDRSWWPSGEEDLQSIGERPYERGNRWPQPLIRRVDDGLSARVDRLHALGNAQVPAVVALLARAILARVK